jgi:hypothetical protein
MGFEDEFLVLLLAVQRYARHVALDHATTINPFPIIMDLMENKKRGALLTNLSSPS